jgi:hypothetical protein
MLHSLVIFAVFLAIILSPMLLANRIASGLRDEPGRY